MRRPPEYDKQRFPEATLHVGQRTERNNSGVMSFIRIGICWGRECAKTAQNGTLISIVLLMDSRKRRANNDSTTFRALVGFNHRCWGFRFLSTRAVGEFGPVQARPRSLADTGLGENGDHKTGHDAMGPPPCFQGRRRRTTTVHDGGRTTNRITTRNICQSGLPLFQN